MPTRNDKQHNLATFAVAERQYAVPAACIEQIVPLPEVACPPDAPPLLLGFVDLAGESVPAIRLHRLFQLPETPLGLWTPLIIVRDEGRRLALLVDRVNQVVRLDAEAVLALPAGHGLSDCVQGVWRSAGGPVLLLSPQRLLLQQEQARLVELQERTQRRLRECEGMPS
jgi:purine-binding chemotaxis protein CheW